jgi:hypothetical protein
LRKHTAALLVALTLIGLLEATSASGHAGNPNYSSEVKGLARPVPGITIQVLGFDDRMQILDRSGKTVVVYGYNGEPYARILPDGTVQENSRSPAYYLNQDRFAEVQVPATANPDAPPDWTDVSNGGELTWHDHRMHWMSPTTPAKVKDKGKRTKIFDYRIPLRIAGRPDAIQGTLYWVGSSSGAPIAAIVSLVAVVLLAIAGSIWFRRRRRRDDDDRGAEPEPAAEAW